MDKQEFYNNVKKYFSRPEAEYAIRKDGTCVYRGLSVITDREIKCGIGCVIPDTHYNPDFEGVPVTDILNSKMDGQESLVNYWKVYSQGDIDFLSKIQNTHDDFASTGDVDIFLDKLEEIALNYNLITD